MQQVTAHAFQATQQLSDGFEGMFTQFSMAVIDSLLAFQSRAGIHGDAMELGVFRGKSAAVLGRNMAPSETLYLYDIADQFDRERLQRSGARIEYVVKDTGEVRRSDLRKVKRGVRFCHIDTSHTFAATLHEMALADYVLSDGGIVCLDDYTNLNYSQMLAATFAYLFRKRTDLAIFLVTPEKAFLCRESSFLLYARYVLDELRQQMAERGIPETCIARTDCSPQYRAFHLRKKLPGETDDVYGRTIYRQFYEIETSPTLAQRIRRTLAQRMRRVMRRHPGAGK